MGQARRVPIGLMNTRKEHHVQELSQQPVSNSKPPGHCYGNVLYLQRTTFAIQTVFKDS